MAHKTLIGGTAYEITGGKTLIGGTAYSVVNGKTLVGGTTYDVGFGGWDDLDTGLEFISTSAFTLELYGFVGWNGIMEYCNGRGWKTWNGDTISSRENENGHCLYIRGIGNTKVCVGYPFSWRLSGSNIKCNGNIEKLLDYATVKAGLHPTMADLCYSYLFY